MADLNNRIEEIKMIKYQIGFIISVFFAISFLITASVSILEPALTVEFIKTYPLFSWMNPIIGYAIHLLGNIFFTAVAIFFALDCWRKYNGNK